MNAHQNIELLKKVAVFHFSTITKYRHCYAFEHYDTISITMPGKRFFGIEIICFQLINGRVIEIDETNDNQSIVSTSNFRVYVSNDKSLELHIG